MFQEAWVDHGRPLTKCRIDPGYSAEMRPFSFLYQELQPLAHTVRLRISSPYMFHSSCTSFLTSKDLEGVSNHVLSGPSKLDPYLMPSLATLSTHLRM